MKGEFENVLQIKILTVWHATFFSMTSVCLLLLLPAFAHAEGENVTHNSVQSLSSLDLENLRTSVFTSCHRFSISF